MTRHDLRHAKGSTAGRNGAFRPREHAENPQTLGQAGSGTLELRELEQLLEAHGDEIAEVAANGDHVELAQLDAALAVADPDLPVVHDRGGYPNAAELHSFRGFYDELAMAPDGGRAMTVDKFRRELGRADGATFVGWKGGEFTMGEHTPLWLAGPGVLGPSIRGVVITDDAAIVVTDADGVS